MIDGRLGITLAVISAIFNGSFTILFKTTHMVNLSINPIIFQLYVSWGVFLSSWFVLPFVLNENKESFLDSFSAMGIIAGGLFVLAISASFQAIDYVGVAVAQGIWGGIAMVISYIWGTFLFGEIPSNIGLSVFALCLLVTGVLFIAFCEMLGRSKIFSLPRTLFRRTSDSELETELLISNEISVASAAAIETSDYITGILWACCVGIFGGSILAPLHYVPEQGLIFLPSFGIGALLTSPIVLLLQIACTGEVPDFHWKDALVTGMISGFIYNTGNALSIIAITSIGYGIAYPILQCAVLVSGLWGIFLFKEITYGPAICVFFTGGFTLLLGGILLTVSR